MSHETRRKINALLRVWDFETYPVYAIDGIYVCFEHDGIHGWVNCSGMGYEVNLYLETLTVGRVRFSENCLKITPNGKCAGINRIDSQIGCIQRGIHHGYTTKEYDAAPILSHKERWESHLAWHQKMGWV